MIMRQGNIGAVNLSKRFQYLKKRNMNKVLLGKKDNMS